MTQAILFEERKVYFPRNLEAAMRLIRRARNKHGSKATCVLKTAPDGLLTLNIVVEP